MLNIARIFEEKFYVDDVLTGADPLEQTQRIVLDAMQYLQ